MNKKSKRIEIEASSEWLDEPMQPKNNGSGYQPIDTLDTSKPPEGGSAVPPIVQKIQFEAEVASQIVDLLKSIAECMVSMAENQNALKTELLAQRTLITDSLSFRVPPFGGQWQNPIPTKKILNKNMEFRTFQKGDGIYFATNTLVDKQFVGFTGDIEEATETLLRIRFVLGGEPIYLSTPTKDVREAIERVITHNQHDGIVWVIK